MSKLVSKETFEQMAPKVQRAVLFDQNVVICEDISEIKKMIKKRALWDKFCSTMGGVIGGSVAMIGKFLMFK